MALIVDHLKAEVPNEIGKAVATTSPPLSNNLPTVNAIQAMSDPAIVTLMASMMVNMEVMRVQLEGLDTERRDSG